MTGRICPKCGKDWSDFELMTKGGIQVGKTGPITTDITALVCPNCKIKLKEKKKGLGLNK